MARYLGKCGFGIGLIILLVCNLDAFGQSVANYTPAMSNGITYTSISSTGKSVAIWRNNAANQNDDNRSASINIGFDFWYLGTRYTGVNISTNGFIDFSGATYDGNASSGTDVISCGPTTSISYRQDPNAFSTSGCAAAPPISYSGTYIALAPLYTDLWVSGGTAALSASIKYLTTGSAPNRVFTAEYINFDDFAPGVSAFNFQVKLYETTGKIEFVYGSMVGFGGSTTTTNYALGINNSTMSAVPAASELLVQQSDNTATFSNAIQNSLTTFPVSNSLLSFTSNVPANPSGSLTFTGVTTTGATLNWTDWASNENGYVIYNSTDGVNYSFVSQAAANATSAAVSNLFSGTTYFWNVYAVTEGALSSALSGTQATTAGSTFVSTQTGPWNTGSTWVGGAVPSGGDNATISAGHIVTIDGSNSITNLTVNGTLKIGNNATARTFTVVGNTTIAAATGSFTSGSAATHSLFLGGNVANNNIFNMAPGGGSLTNVTLNKNGSQTFSGTGATTTFNLLNLNMGSALTNVADFTCSSFSAPSDFLTLTNGTFKFSVPSAAVALNLFAAGATVSNTTGIFMNSPNSTMTFLATMTFQGDLTVNSGTVTVGNAADENLMCYGGNITITGGAVNVAGRFSRPSVVVLTNFTMSAGTLTVNTLGSNDASPPAGPPVTATSYPFMMDVPGSLFNVTGGTIVIRRSGSGAAATNLGYNVTNITNYTYSGGLLQIGDASTPAGNTFQINTDQPIPSLTIFGTNSPTALLAGALTVTGGLTINTNGTLNCGGFDFTDGGGFNNSGTYTPGANTTTFNGTSTVIGNVTTFNNLLVASGATLNGHIVNMNVAGDWTNNGGTFVPGNATVTFTGTGTNVITGTAATQTFNNLTINRTGGGTAGITLSGSTTTLTLNNNFIETAGAFTLASPSTMNVAGNWTHTAGTFTPSSSEVIFNGTAAQTITYTAATETFNSLTVNKTAGTLLNTGGSITTLTLTGDFKETLGNFTPPANFNIAGNWTHNAGTFTAGTTTTFNGNTAQTMSSTSLTSESFVNLIINKTTGTTLSANATYTTISLTGNYTNTLGNFTFPATVNIAGTVTLTAGTVTAGTLIDVKGSTWANNGGTFTPGTGTVSFISAVAQVINGTATLQTFNNLTINKSGNTLSVGGSTATLTIGGNYTQTLGNFTAPATTNVGGDWKHDAGTFTPGGAGTVVFNGAAGQTITSAALTIETFNNMTVNKASGLLNTGGTITAITVSAAYNNLMGNFTAPATLTLTGNATLTAGILTSGALIDVKANWTNNGGTFGPLTGTIKFSGAGAQAINGTATVQNFNNFQINKGNTLSIGGSTATLNIQGNYVQTAGNFTAFASGVTNVSGGWAHDAGTFSPNTGTVTFNGTGTQNIASASLTIETFYNLSVSKTASTLLQVTSPIVTITVTNNYSQTLGDFTPPATLNVGGNWTHDAGSFNPGAGTVIFNGAGGQVMSSGALTTESFNNFTVTKAGGTLSTSTTFTNINIAGNVLLTAGTFTTGTMMDVKGNWTNNGATFTPSTSTVSFTSATAQTIGGTAAAQTFNNLTINKSANGLATTGSTVTLNINGNYLQTLGNFTAPTTTAVGGNWTHEAGTFTPGSNTVNFNGAGAQTISSSSLTSEAYYNFTVSKGGGTLNTGGTITSLDINQNVTLTSGTFAAPANMTVFATWGKAVASTFTPGTGTVTFDGSAAQVINGAATSQTFYNLTVNKTVGFGLTAGGSTASITVQNYTNTQGNFTSPATFNVNGDVLLTTGTFTAGTNVNVSGNWTYNGGTFTPGANTVTFNGTAGQQTISGSPITFGALKFNNTFGTSPQVVVSTPVFVNTSLTMTAGQVQTDITNVIRLAAYNLPCTIGSAASFISGPLQFVMAVNATTANMNFPIGKNGVYGGATLSVRHSAATSYVYTAEVINSSATALNYTLAAGTTLVSSIRYWDIKRGLTASPLTSDNTSITGSPNAPRITLYYETADQVSDPTKLTIVKTIGPISPSSTWNDIAGVASGSPTGNIISGANNANFTSFSYFTFANKTGGTNSLPISLISFSGSQIGNNVVLNWTTESEQNNDRFDVERLANGEKFAVLGSVKGAGNSIATLNYSFSDPKATTGTNYYRLSQYDYDGTATQSKVIAIDFEEKSHLLSVGVSPNPSSAERMNISISGASNDGPLSLKIIDMTGRTIAERTDSIDGAGSFNWEFQQPLSPGIYILQGTQGYSKAQYKLVVR